jgi:GTP-binding protein
VAVPVVAIVGRPNVGKSSLFNMLAGKRIAIVEPTAGVTRDRVSSILKADDLSFELVDTGGMGIQDIDNLTEHVERQIETAIDQAQVILFVLDARSGLTPLDARVAKHLRGVSKAIFCVANKCDTPHFDLQAAEFHKLGLGPVICVSAHQKRGRRELLDLVLEHLVSPEPGTVVAEPAMKIAIVGRRNAGKSTFINSLVQEERMIVSEVPGTTRDSVDVRFERDGKVFIAIDTAGVRRKRSIGSDIEFYSMARAERSIRRADVVLHFLDARLSISKVDKQLAEYVLQQYKPAIFVVNKWDLMRPMPTGTLGDYIRATFPNLDFVPISFITAKSGRNVYATLNLAQNLFKQAATRVSTGDLNRVVREALVEQSPPMRQNRRPKIYYGTQVATHPPTIVLITNGPELFDPPYQRYLLKTFRDRLPFADVPIKLHLRHKHRSDRVPSESLDDSDSESQPARVEGLSEPAGRGRQGSGKRKQAKSRKGQKSEVWKDI